MAKWKVKSSTGGTIAGGFEYEGGSKDGDSYWNLYQDERPFIEQAKLDRELQSNLKKTDAGYKKFATIPDIVAIDIKMKWGIDLHDPHFFDDVDKKAKFFTIIKQEYPYLLSYE